MAVCLRLGDGCSADRTARAWSVVDYDRLTDSGRKLTENQSCKDINAGAG
jgi:hypothetical protein